MNDEHWEWQGSRAEAPAPRSDGDKFADARMIINSARLILPANVTDRPKVGGSTQEQRQILADYLRRHEIPVPGFIPVVFGWSDCFTGQLANPAAEPGANGRTHS